MFVKNNPSQKYDSNFFAEIIGKILLSHINQAARKIGLQISSKNCKIIELKPAEVLVFVNNLPNYRKCQEYSIIFENFVVDYNSRITKNNGRSMPDSIKNYVPQIAVVKMRRQAFVVWSVSAFLVAVWVFLIVLAPIAEANNLTGASQPIYKFFSFICHQMNERSLHVENHPFAVCSRCFGVYFGLFLGFVIYPLIRKIDEIEPLPRFWLFLAMIPIGIDWSLGVFGIWENTHLSRFVTGMILGTACAVFIVPALVEIFRLLSGKNKRQR
jgi:uncharacterized membrane protein